MTRRAEFSFDGTGGVRRFEDAVRTDDVTEWQLLGPSRRSRAARQD